jgi:hypothetical protein
VARIIVYIDESGNPFENEIAFSTAAVWCVVEKPEGREKPLKPTVDSMKQYLRDHGKMEWAQEIHHHRLPDEYSEYLLFQAISLSRRDRTILREGIFWERSPVAFTMAIDNPRAVKAFDHSMTQQVLGNRTRLGALGNLLRPLSIYEGPEHIRAELILDSEVWKKCVERYDAGLKKTIGNQRIDPAIHFCRSSITPGLQIADLAAGINRQFIINARQESGYRLLQANILNRLRR